MALISKSGMFHPATEEKILTLTWCCNVGHACCSTATEQMWVLLNRSVDGPERNNSHFTLFLPCYLPFFHSHLQIQIGTKQMPLLSKNVLVLPLFSVSSYLLHSLQSLAMCSIHKVQGFSCVKLWNDIPLWFLSSPMFFMYAQLLVSWREEMRWPVLVWLCVKLTFKTLNTWSMPASVHMWMCVCVGPRVFLRFLKGFECGWSCIKAEPEWWLCRDLKTWGDEATRDGSIYW